MSIRSWTIVLAAALAWMAAGGGAGPALAQKEPTTLLVLTRNQPRSLDPAKGSDNPTRKVFVGVYEPLIDHKQGTADIPTTWKASWPRPGSSRTTSRPTPSTSARTCRSTTGRPSRPTT